MFNNAEHILSSELTAAARNLEERIKILGLPLLGFELHEWNVIAPEIRSLIPPWLMVLHSRFKLANVVLEFENYNRDAHWSLMFRWMGPRGLGIDMKDGLYRELYYREVIAHGYIIFATAEGGPDWAATLTEGPEGDIYFFDQSAYSGGKPAEDNGLVYAHKNLASLLAAMAISNVSYPTHHASRGRMGFWGQ